MTVLPAEPKPGFSIFLQLAPWAATSEHPVSGREETSLQSCFWVILSRSNSKIDIQGIGLTRPWGGREGRVRAMEHCGCGSGLGSPPAAQVLHADLYMGIPSHWISSGPVCVCNKDPRQPAGPEGSVCSHRTQWSHWWGSNWCPWPSWCDSQPNKLPCDQQREKSLVTQSVVQGPTCWPPWELVKPTS